MRNIKITIKHIPNHIERREGLIGEIREEIQKCCEEIFFQKQIFIPIKNTNESVAFCILPGGITEFSNAIAHRLGNRLIDGKSINNHVTLSSKTTPSKKKKINK